MEESRGRYLTDFMDSRFSVSSFFSIWLFLWSRLRRLFEADDPPWTLWRGDGPDMSGSAVVDFSISAAEALRSSLEWLALKSRSLDSSLTDRSDLTLKKLRRLVEVRMLLSLDEGDVTDVEVDDDDEDEDEAADDISSELPSSRNVRSVRKSPRNGTLGVGGTISLLRTNEQLCVRARVRECMSVCVP